MKLAVNQIRERIQQLVGGAQLAVESTGEVTHFVMRFYTNTMTWRNLRLITEHSQTYRASTVPTRVYDAPIDIQREFVRGLADVCGFVRTSNVDQAGRHRVYIQVPPQNWVLPIDICRLLQESLRVPVQMIQWNHPNTRIPRVLDAKLTGREHQVKIFAQAFRDIGFHVDYKQEILEQLAIYNEEHFGACPGRCNPNPESRRSTQKPSHPEENNPLIPESIRGQHFDSYWQICTALGCDQCRPHDPQQGRLFDDIEDEDAHDAHE